MKSLLVVVLFFLLAQCQTFSRQFHKHHRHHHHEREYVFCYHKDGGHMHYKSTLNADVDENPECLQKIAALKYSNKINETGWGFMDAETLDESVAEHEQGYAVGFLEGRATRDLIRSHLYNTADDYCENRTEYCDRLFAFATSNLDWMVQQVQKNESDPFWVQVNMTLSQLRGMIDGYEGTIDSTRTLEQIARHPLYLIQMAGDIEDLEAKLNSPKPIRKTYIGSGHCSALVKVSETGDELFTSHVTWSSYSSMLRLQKRFRFKLCECKTPGHSYTLSSYPGSLPSVDDFLLSSAGLAILETTIQNYNKQLFKYITPSTLPTWVRSLVATRLSKSGKQWALNFLKHNSGTYNNQWMIVDYKKFSPGKPLPKRGLLYVLEQLPGTHSEHEDMTHVLHTQGYWPSYNMPFFPRVYEASGTGEQAKKFGNWFTYSLTPRALIFKRDQKGIRDMTAMRKLMRSNDYEHDPLSRCNCTPPYSAENAIACRSDLNPRNGSYPFESLGFRDHGATDMKAIAGPTHDPVPVFDWTTALFDPPVRHEAQPQRWTFLPIVYQWPSVSLFIH